MSLHHLPLDNPVTKCDTESQVPWLHGCVVHCLFQDEEICTHVKYMSLKVMNKFTEEILNPLEANEISLQVLHKLSNEPPLREFLKQFFFPSVANKVVQVQAEVVYRFSAEYQIVSFSMQSI